MSDLNSLELRLKRIEDQLELLRLEGAYAYFYDRGDGQAWAALFTEDGFYAGRQHAGMGEATTPGAGRLSTLAVIRRRPSTGYLRFLLGVGGRACASP